MLNQSRLERVKTFGGGKIICQCPACHEDGADRKGDHLAIFPSGKFHCIINESNEHRKRIFELVGIVDNKELTHEEKRAYAKRKAKEEATAKRASIEADRLRAISEAINPKKALRPYIRDDWRKWLTDSSPFPLDSANHQARFIEQMFNGKGILWMGDVYDSGKAENSANFKASSEWIEWNHQGNPWHPRIAAGTFKPGSISRGKDHVISSPYIVIESDELTKKESAALAKFLVARFRLKLRAVIDTGNKSLHLWYDRPPKRITQAIKPILTALKYDEGLFNGSDHSPLRMPGCIHKKTGKPAELLFLNY